MSHPHFISPITFSSPLELCFFTTLCTASADRKETAFRRFDALSVQFARVSRKCRVETRSQKRDGCENCRLDFSVQEKTQKKLMSFGKTQKAVKFHKRIRIPRLGACRMAGSHEFSSIFRLALHNQLLFLTLVVTGLVTGFEIALFAALFSVGKKKAVPSKKRNVL